MSYKIKTLSDRQCSELLSRGDDSLFGTGQKLYLTTVLPGLFYCVTDKIKNIQEENFLYIPPSILDSEYSPGVFDSIIYKNFMLQPKPIALEGKSFYPVVVENIPVGGLLCDSGDGEEPDRQKLLEKFALSEYFNLIFNVNSSLAGGEFIALQILRLISEKKSFDSFLRALPNWLVEFLGGGLVSVYYRSDDDYLLRKMAGQLSLYEEMPAELEREDAALLMNAIAENHLFMSVGEVPNYVTELKVPPQIRFVMGGSDGCGQEYLLTGIVPNITSYSFALFFDRLKSILGGVTERHFAGQPDWQRVFSVLEELSASGRSKQEMIEAIFPIFCEYVNINRISLVKYHQMENQLEIEGAVTSRPNTILGTKITFPLAGTAFETVVEMGRPYFKDNLNATMAHKVEYQLFKEGVKSYLMVPIRDEKTLVGILNIGSPMTDDYLHRHLPVFETLAGYLARLFISGINRQEVEIYSRQLEDLQASLSAMENLKNLGELASGVFHDLNNMIGGVLGRCEIIQSRLEKHGADETTTKIIRDVKLIERSALDSGEILNRLRELSRTRREQKKVTICLNEIIDDSVEMVRPRWRRLIQDKGIKILLKKETSDRVNVVADPSEMREVLTNLLLNALDALPEGGRIAVSCGRINGTARVIVGDNGTGIPAELMEKIFDPFFTTKGDKGTGLGLAVSKKIIEGHGGHIRVSSGKDKGTTFVIDLPALEEEKELQPAVQNSSSMVKGRKVLIIQGQEAETPELLQCLTDKSCRVTTAESGAGAILICTKEKFDLLIVDLTLPDISGLDLISQIRSFDRKTRIILISDHEIDASVGDLMSKGIDSLLTRPIDGEIVSMTLENLLGSVQERN